MDALADVIIAISAFAPFSIVRTLAKRWAAKMKSVYRPFGKRPLPFLLPDHDKPSLMPRFGVFIDMCLILLAMVFLRHKGSEVNAAHLRSQVAEASCSLGKLGG